MPWTNNAFQCPACEADLKAPDDWLAIQERPCPHCGQTFKYVPGVYGMLMAALEPLIAKHGGSLPSTIVPNIAEQVRAQSLAGDDQDARDMLNKLSVAGLLKVRLERPRHK